MRFVSSLAFLSAVGAASAQLGPWDRCGGISYTGSTTCASTSSALTSSAAGTTFSTAVSATRQPTSTVSPASSAVSSTPMGTVRPTGSSSFAKVDGRKFNIDGKTKYFAGTNSYWLPFLTNDADVDSVFKNLKESGLKILRVWGFNDVNTVPKAGTIYFQLHDKATGTTTINTGTDGLKRLDYVVSAAEKYGVKLIIPFVNSWDDYGGMNAYVNAYGGSKTGWYTDAKIQSIYQAYIKAIVLRYKTSPAVFAWELANEPRCSGCNTDIITN